MASAEELINSIFDQTEEVRQIVDKGVSPQYRVSIETELKEIDNLLTNLLDAMHHGDFD